MTKPDKLYAMLTSGSGGGIVSFRDFERLLLAYGFVLDRTTGSHRQYVHPSIRRAFPVQPTKSGEAKRYQVRDFLELVEEHGLHIKP